MSAYVLVDVDVTDQEAYDVYKGLAADAVASQGGRYLARGGTAAVLEGGWEPSRVAVLEFPDVEAARRWYDSDDYRKARDARSGAADMRMIIVEGVPQ